MAARKPITRPKHCGSPRGSGPLAARPRWSADRHALLPPDGGNPGRPPRAPGAIFRDGRRFVRCVDERPANRTRGQLGRGQALRRDGGAQAERNILGLAASNSPSTTVSPDRNPAGVIGLLKVEFDQGEPLLVPTDATLARVRDRDSRLGSRRHGRRRVERARDRRTAGRRALGEDRRLEPSPAAVADAPPRIQGQRGVKRATAHVCGLGFFDFEVNGQPVSDQLMNPALTGYDRRALYVTFDVTRGSRPATTRSASRSATADISRPGATFPYR